MADDIIRFSCMSTLCTMHMIEEHDTEINNIKKTSIPFNSKKDNTILQKLLNNTDRIKFPANKNWRLYASNK